CGPCSEIHIDIRDDKERANLPGIELVNKDHPEVIEIWNLVFIEFNRAADGKLNPLPSKHVDTGMGFERLCLVLQGVKSNYDTDVFQPIIRKIAEIAGVKYGEQEDADIAIRVIADHLRAIAFAIADGQLPSNTGAGYVIRRILRRAVRYAYTFLDLKDPFISDLLPVLVKEMGGVFPELKKQETLISRVIKEEETSFLRTLAQGIRKFDQYIKSNPDLQTIDGNFAFELFDTYGFPIDLTQLMAREIDRDVDMNGFYEGLDAQKNRSKQAAARDTEDWQEVSFIDGLTTFLGYDHLEADVRVVKYRKTRSKNKDFYEIVLDQTPFYAEAGGQVGDTGQLIFGEEKIPVIDTKKENDLIIHVSTKFPADPGIIAHAEVNSVKRNDTINNHSATHLMHHALRKVLGDHVEQKGSLVDENHLRFDFSHFQKLTDEEIMEIEAIVNKEIRMNLTREEKRSVPIDKALEMGAIAFFGEKYGDEVRVVKFGDSIELCGGTHVPQTGQIGFFKIISEGAIAAGIRRIEGLTGVKAEAYLQEQGRTVASIKNLIKGQKDIVRGVESLIEENSKLQRQMAQLNKDKVRHLESQLTGQVEDVNGVHFLTLKLEDDNALIKDLAFSMLKGDEQLFMLIGNRQNDKVFLTLAIGRDLIDKKGLNSGALIRDFAKEINGGGGGQPHFATAGGSNPRGLDIAFEMAREFVENL
ncbi:MAG: alanine--tRNA ligase, partial [Bacteroidota bacterium]|nr:alanine--tRNA ligase [Bacteroidota bacterium]